MTGQIYYDYDVIQNFVIVCVYIKVVVIYIFQSFSNDSDSNNLLVYCVVCISPIQSTIRIVQYTYRTCTNNCYTVMA